MNYKILVLTDHKTHREGESIYPLLRKMSLHSACQNVDVATRGDERNTPFFTALSSTKLVACTVNDGFNYKNRDQFFSCGGREVLAKEYDVLFLRVDRPISKKFLDFIDTSFKNTLIVNNPQGIVETGSKEFLLRFPELCPPIKLCRTIDDIKDFSEKFPVVLKPLEGYGGKGLIKIEDNYVWDEDKKFLVDDFLPAIESRLESQPFLAMKFLPHIDDGDKRVIVINGEVIGAILRFPQKGSWLANLSKGGTYRVTEVAEEEREIAKTLWLHMKDKGVVVFGFDTLVNDLGKRVLSEVNTLNVGGMYEVEESSGKPALQRSSDLIWDYILEN